MLPKMKAPALSMTPLFYYKFPVYSNNGDVCKNLKINRVRFEWDMKNKDVLKILEKIVFKLKPPWISLFSRLNFLVAQRTPPPSPPHSVDKHWGYFLLWQLISSCNRKLLSMTGIFSLQIDISQRADISSSDSKILPVTGNF